jgi:hypothetical protein
MPVVGDEDFVLGQFAVADHGRRLKGQAAHLAGALDGDEAVGSVVLDGDFDAWVDRQFLGAEEFLAGDLAVDDPAVDVSLGSGVGDRNRLEVVAVLELRVDVALPVEGFDEVIEVVRLFGGHVLDEQRPGDRSAFDHRLVHAEDVGTPLRFVGHERAGGVEDARRDEPAGAGLQAIGLRVVEDAVVADVPAFETAAEVFLGRPRLEAEKRVGEIVADGVQLRWKIVGLGFTLAT